MPPVSKPLTDQQLMLKVLERNDLSQRQLADLIGVSFQLISCVVTGRRPLTRRTVDKMVAAGVLIAEMQVTGNEYTGGRG